MGSATTEPDDNHFLHFDEESMSPVLGSELLSYLFDLTVKGEV